MRNKEETKEKNKERHKENPIFSGLGSYVQSVNLNILENFVHIAI